MKLRYFSHSTFQITSNGKVILIDPFIDDNPTCPIKTDSLEKVDYIVLTHAHGDHIGDALKLAKRFDPLIISVNELADYVSGKGFRAHNMHIGGSHNFDFGRVKFTIAHHGSITPDGIYGGEPAGVVLTIESKNIYHTGDTGLFLDMKLIGELNPIDYMLVPIGDNFTMGIDDAVKAVEFVNPRFAIPMHYNTWPIIEADPKEFESKVLNMDKKARVLDFGEEIEI